MKLINEIKVTKNKYLDSIYSINIKQRLLIYLIAWLFTIFFISAPVALIINLYLFVEYFVIISLATSFLVFLAYNIFYIITYSMLKRKLNFDFSLKYLYIENIIISFVLSTIVFLFLLLVVKELVI